MKWYGKSKSWRNHLTREKLLHAKSKYHNKRKRPKEKKKIGNLTTIKSNKIKNKASGSERMKQSEIISKISKVKRTKEKNHI